MSATPRPLVRIDPGWLFVIGGLAMLVAVVLLPGRRAVQQMQEQLRALKDQEAYAYQRLNAHEDFLRSLRAGDGQVIRRLAASHLNLMPEGETPIMLASSLDQTVPDWIDDTVTFEPSPAQPYPDTLLIRLAEGRHRLWLLCGSVLAIFFGLIMGPEFETRSRRTRPADPPVTEAEGEGEGEEESVAVEDGEPDGEWEAEEPRSEVSDRDDLSRPIDAAVALGTMAAGGRLGSALAQTEESEWATVGTDEWAAEADVPATDVPEEATVGDALAEEETLEDEIAEEETLEDEVAEEEAHEDQVAEEETLEDEIAEEETLEDEVAEEETLEDEIAEEETLEDEIAEEESLEDEVAEEEALEDEIAEEETLEDELAEEETLEDKVAEEETLEDEVAEEEAHEDQVAEEETLEDEVAEEETLEDEIAEEETLEDEVAEEEEALEDEIAEEETLEDELAEEEALEDEVAEEETLEDQRSAEGDAGEEEIVSLEEVESVDLDLDPDAPWEDSDSLER